MKKTTNNDGCAPLQTYALNDRKNILKTINQEAAFLGIRDTLIPHRVFTSLFIQLAKTRWEEATPPPMAFMRKIVRRILLGECRGEKRRRERERNYVELHPESSTTVGDICLDAVDFRAVERKLQTIQNTKPASMEERMALEIVSCLTTEDRLPSQEELAGTLGISQAGISRLQARSYALLRNIIEQNQN